MCFFLIFLENGTARHFRKINGSNGARLLFFRIRPDRRRVRAFQVPRSQGKQRTEWPLIDGFASRLTERHLGEWFKLEIPEGRLGSVCRSDEQRA